MRLPHNAPLRSPLTERFSAEDISFIQEWLEAVDEECVTPRAGVLHPPTLHWTAQLLNDDDNTKAPQATPAPKPIRKVSLSEEEYDSFVKMNFYYGVAVGVLMLFLVSIICSIFGISLTLFGTSLIAVMYFFFGYRHYRKVDKSVSEKV